MSSENRQNEESAEYQKMEENTEQQVEKVELSEEKIEEIRESQAKTQTDPQKTEETKVQQVTKNEATEQSNPKQPQTQTLKKQEQKPKTIPQSILSLKKQYIPPISNPHQQQLIKHRRNQAETLRNLIKTMKQQLKGNQFHLHVLEKQKTQLQDQVGGLDLRLKGILREKEVLFARLMTGQREVERLSGM